MQPVSHLPKSVAFCCSGIVCTSTPVLNACSVAPAGGSAAQVGALKPDADAGAADVLRSA